MVCLNSEQTLFFSLFFLQVYLSMVAWVESWDVLHLFFFRWMKNWEFAGHSSFFFFLLLLFKLCFIKVIEYILFKKNTFLYFQFVAHPNVQQLLASIWYEGLPGFRQMNIAFQLLEIVRIGLMFPIFALAYIICPWSSFSLKMRKPFIKFICSSTSYLTFLSK